MLPDPRKRQESHKRGRISSPRRENLALIVAAFSFGVSLAVGVVGYIAFHERTSVHLEGFAVANTLGSTPGGYGIDVSIINDSLRPVIVRSVSLEVDGVPVTEAAEYLPEPRILNDQSTRGDRPIEQAVAFPLAIPARGARTIGALFRFGHVDEVWYARERRSSRISFPL